MIKQFTKLMTTAAFLATIATPAYADLICGPARIDVGDQHNSVVQTQISINNHVWTVLHTLTNGKVVDRSLQYFMQDMSYDNNIQWTGVLATNPHMHMIGKIMQLKSTGQPIYNESLFKDGQLVMHSEALCKDDNTASLTNENNEENIPIPETSTEWWVLTRAKSTDILPTICAPLQQAVPGDSTKSPMDVYQATRLIYPNTTIESVGEDLIEVKVPEKDRAILFFRTQDACSEMAKIIKNMKKPI